jgi:hypothetical protein
MWKEAEEVHIKCVAIFYKEEADYKGSWEDMSEGEGTLQSA